MKAQRGHVERERARRDQHPRSSHVTAFHPGGDVQARCIFCGGLVVGLAGLRERCPERTVQP